MHNFTCVAFEHYIAWMTITQSKNVTNHRHHRKTSGVVGSSIQPNLRILRFNPKYLLKIFAESFFQCISKNLDLIRQRANFEVLTHLLHEFILNVRNDVVLRSVFFNQNVECVAIRYPTDQPSVLAKRYDRVTSD